MSTLTFCRLVMFTQNHPEQNFSWMLYIPLGMKAWPASCLSFFFSLCTVHWTEGKSCKKNQMTPIYHQHPSSQKQIKISKASGQGWGYSWGLGYLLSGWWCLVCCCVWSQNYLESAYLDCKSKPKASLENNELAGLQHITRYEKHDTYIQAKGT